MQTVRALDVLASQDMLVCCMFAVCALGFNHILEMRELFGLDSQCSESVVLVFG